LTSVKRTALLLYAFLLLGYLLPGSTSPFCKALAQPVDTWLLIDSRALTLSVMRGDSVLQTYENIAIGSNGATREKRARDEKTPLGDFTISGIRPSEHFHIFLAIDYPNMDHVQRALQSHRIGVEEYRSLREAWNTGKSPPQDTRLGGNLGIHGIGSGSLEIHNNINWTNGCIAVTNEQVEELAGWVRVGSRVSIR
jgi:murein L,D-transpeptidase YafK